MMVAELKDRRIGFATLTRVNITADLSQARILVSVMGSVESQEETLRGLSSAAGYIRHELGRHLRLRRVPELVFVLDHGPEEALKIDAMLQKLKSGNQ